MDVTKLDFALEFDGICWVVRLCQNTYGDYLSKDQAVFDAMEAAAGAQQLGHEAEVWDRSTGRVGTPPPIRFPRVFSVPGCYKPSPGTKRTNGGTPRVDFN